MINLKFVLTVVILIVSSFKVFASELTPNMLTNGLSKLSYADLVKVQKYSKNYLYLSDSGKYAFHKILNSIDCKSLYLEYQIDAVYKCVNVVLKKHNKDHLKFLDLEKDKLIDYMAKKSEMSRVASFGKFRSTHTAFMVVLNNILKTVYDVNFSSIETHKKNDELGLLISFNKNLITDLNFWKSCSYYSELTAEVFDISVEKEIYDFIPKFIENLNKILAKLNEVI